MQSQKARVRVGKGLPGKVSALPGTLSETPGSGSVSSLEKWVLLYRFLFLDCWKNERL